jgi:hypothetical protein
MKRLMTLMFCFFGTIVSADGLAAPNGPVILTVTGNITYTNGDGIAQFDQDMLAELTQRTTTTQTPWFDAAHDFTGPVGAAILDAVGATGATLSVVALNDYAAEVPAQDLRDHAVVFATHVDGQRMSVRDKGPLFMIYPFDEEPDLFNEVYFGRSVWQISRIDVKD